MRDPKRIEPFINALKSLWEKNPDLRFWQLGSYITGGNRDAFNWEDDVSLKLIEDKIHDSKRSTKISGEG